MALTIGQIAAAAYNAVLNKNRKAENQWLESALMREMERQKMIKRVSFGVVLEETLDYRRNPGAKFLAFDLETVGSGKTEVLTATNFDIAELSAPVQWSKKDEVQTPRENQKVAFAGALVSNALDTHDDLIEEALFTTSTNGFIGLVNHIPTSGQSSTGGIDSTTEVFWRNVSNTYVDETDIEAGMTATWNECAKGSGSNLAPTLIASDAETQALFEGTQQGLQRYVDTQELAAGFKILAFKTARYVFSQYGTTSLFFLNPKNFRLYASKEYFRHRGETQENEDANGFKFKIYSALQTVVNNRSRLGVLHV